MSNDRPSYQVFISHASADTWVARQIARHVEECGASTFLDEAHVAYGDDFEERIRAATQSSQELLVLLTPWSIERKYVWLEIGAMWGQGKRIVGVLHGIGANDVVTREGIPELLKRISLVDLNKLDTYLQQLRTRIEKGS